MSLTTASPPLTGGQVGLVSCPFAGPSPVTWPLADRYRTPSHGNAPWPRVSPENRRLLARLDVLSLPDVDQRPGAVPPCPQALRDARTFVLSLPRRLVHPPDIGLADDGEVNFLWNNVGLHIDLGFYGSGTFSYYARDEDGKEYLADECRVSDGLPGDLTTLLTR